MLLSIILVRYGQVPSDAEDGESLARWALLAMLGAVILIALGLAVLAEWSNRRRFNAGDRSVQIERLTTSLKDALTVIDTIKWDIESGNRTLAELEQRSEVQRQLAQLNAAETEAVRAALRAEFRDQSRSSLVRDVIVGSAFFVLGVVSSYLLGR